MRLPNAIAMVENEHFLVLSNVNERADEYSSVLLDCDTRPEVFFLLAESHCHLEQEVNPCVKQSNGCCEADC